MNFPYLTGETEKIGMGRIPVQASFPSWLARGTISPLNCIAAYEPKDALSYANSKVNKACPDNGLPVGTFDALDGTAFPTWNASGWTFISGSSQYLTTSILPLWNYSIIASFDTTLNTGGILFGSGRTANDRMRFIPRASASNTHHFDFGNGFTNNAARVGNVTAALTGNAAFNGGGIGYVNAVATDVLSNTNFIAPTDPLYIGVARTAGGGLVAFYAGIIKSLYVYDIPLSPTQISYLHSDMPQ